MKICFLVPTLSSGGAERTVSYLAEYGVKNGYEVDIVTLKDEKFYDILDSIKYYTIDDRKKNRNIFGRFNSFLKRIKNFKAYLKESKPDLIFSILCTAVLYPKICNKKLPVVTSERVNPVIGRSKGKRIYRNYWFKHADGMIFQTKSVEEYYKKKKIKGVVIPNAVGNPIAYEYDTPATERENVITAVGRLTDQKDYKTMINAFDVVYEKYPEYQLHIYGKGNDLSKLQDFANTKHCKEAIKFCGIDKEALRHVHKSKCYVMTSLFEGMPNALMEAMAVGTPCVSTNCDYGPADLIQNNINGQLVPVGDILSVANAIIKYIEDKEFSDKVSLEAMKLKETNSIETISKKFFEYFEEVYNRKCKTKNKE